MKNMSKYYSYTEAWKRINNAIKDGFYLEAVTIQESIISDRILSYLKGVDPDSKVRERDAFSQLLKEWRKTAKASVVDEEEKNLIKAVDSWRVNRNTVVHGIVKSEPQKPTKPVVEFLAACRTLNLGQNDYKKLA